MFKITKKENLAPNIYLMDVEAPRIAKYALPGQFLIVRVDEEGERIPLTICDYDSEKGLVQIVFQVIGGDTYRMSSLEVGDSFADMVGPLGKPSDLTEMPLEELKKMKICFIAGGVGTAPVYCQLKWLKNQGVEVDCIQGARTKDIIHPRQCLRGTSETLGRRKEIRQSHRHRPHDHDEVRMSADETARCRDNSIHESHHGGRNRNVRRLPSDGRRKSEIRMC